MSYRHLMPDDEPDPFTRDAAAASALLLMAFVCILLFGVCAYLLWRLA